MVVHEIYAIIYDDVVRNTIVGDYTSCNEYAKANFGETAFAIDITLIPAQTGDTYENGNFYRVINGKKKQIKPVPSDSEQIAELVASNREVTSLLEDTMTLLLELAEGQE